MTKSSVARRDRVRDEVAARGRVTVRELSESLGVSEATVRRDLRELARMGLVLLVHGGATVTDRGNHSFQARASHNAESKRVIGRLAGELVRDGDMLFVDSGTTCYEMRPALLRRRAISVIVHSTRLAAELAVNADANVLMIGGRYRPERMDTIGPMAQRAIDDLRGYVAFIGADGLSPEFGISANDIDSAHLYQHVLRNARDTILLVDHTKFASPSLYRIADLRVASRVVTDRRPSPEWQTVLAELGIELICPNEP